MTRKVFCYECRQWVDYDIAKYICTVIEDPVDCPCDEEKVVPKPFNEEDWGLFSIDSLEPPSDLHRWLRLNPK
jgi:hypothetical protein